MKNSMIVALFFPFLLISAFLFPVTLAQAQQLGDRESVYRDAWCESLNGSANAESNVSLPNLTRADCVTQQYGYSEDGVNYIFVAMAVESDFARNWEACFGDAIAHAVQLRNDEHPKIAACLLILEKPDDFRYVEEAWTAKYAYSPNLPIAIFTMTYSPIDPNREIEEQEVAVDIEQITSQDFLNRARENNQNEGFKVDAGVFPEQDPTRANSPL